MRKRVKKLTSHPQKVLNETNILKPFHMLPIRNDPGRFRSSHANVLGRLVPNGFPKGKKADTRPWVDLTNEAQHVETHEVSVERAEVKSAVDHVSSFNWGEPERAPHSRDTFSCPKRSAYLRLI